MRFAVASGALALLPLITLAYGLVSSGTWANAMAAWRGEILDPVTGAPTNPWGQILPLLVGLILLYLACSQIALRLVRDRNPDPLLRRATLTAALILVLLGTSALFAATAHAENAYVYFAGVLRGRPRIPVALVVGGALGVLGLNAFQVIRLNGPERRQGSKRRGPRRRAEGDHPDQSTGD